MYREEDSVAVERLNCTIFTIFRDELDICGDKQSFDTLWNS